MRIPQPIARSIDALLEATVAGSFTKAGYAVRSWAYGWDEPAGTLLNQTVLVTGGTSGIGKSTAQGLMELGAHVIVTSRSSERAEEAAGELNELALSGSASGMSLDTGDFSSIGDLVEKVKSATPSLDVLVNNAGALSEEYRTDGRGMELTLSTHLVGPYALTKALRPHLSRGARVLWMSSGGMYTQELDVDTIEMSESDYQGAVAYAKAKRGQVEMVKFLGPKWAPDIVMHAMHPGWVDTPGVEEGIPGFGKIMGPTLRDAAQGADTMIWLAATGGLLRDGTTAPPGLFWHDRAPRSTSYLPGTGTGNQERKKLISWLDDQIPENLSD